MKNLEKVKDYESQGVFGKGCYELCFFIIFF